MAENTEKVFKEIDGQKVEDACGAYPFSKGAAVFWFVVLLIISSSLTFVLSRIDSFMYASDAVYLDNVKYSQNRLGSTSIPSGTEDVRAKGAFTAN